MTDFSKAPTQPMAKRAQIDPNAEPPIPSRGHVAWISGDRELLHNGGLLFVVNISNVTNGHGLRIGGRYEAIDSPKWRERVIEMFGRHPTLAEPAQVPEGSAAESALEKRDITDDEND